MSFFSLIVVIVSSFFLVCSESIASRSRAITTCLVSPRPSMMVFVKGMKFCSVIESVYVTAGMDSILHCFSHSRSYRFPNSDVSTTVVVPLPLITSVMFQVLRAKK